MASPTQPRKAVYVCPTCGHDSPVDGDWLVGERELRGEQRLVYGCPVCGRPVTVQPRLEEARDDPAPPTGDGWPCVPVGTSLSTAGRGLGTLASAIRQRTPTP